MTLHVILLCAFLSVTALILLAAYLTRILRARLRKRREKEPPPDREIPIELKGDIFELDKLNIILEDLVRYDVPVKTILDLNIILEEVFTSIVNHHAEGQHDTNVHILLKLEAGVVTVTIRDRNEPFNPLVIPPIDLNAPLEEISFHGLGFHLVRHLADQLSYRRIGDENELTVKKTHKGA
jgi:serine/threonine-protein kinase RsbW